MKRDGSKADDLKISIVIPVHNGGDEFRQCLASLSEAENTPAEIIVVADGCEDNSADLAEEFGAIVLKRPMPEGPARARNIGAYRATGDILFFIDSDVSVYPDALKLVEDAFGKEPNLTAVIGSYDDRPSASNFFSQYKNLFHHYVHQTGNDDASTFWGACGAIKREIFLAIGGFDENYNKPSVEDIQLGYRLKEEGHKIRLLKTLKVTHLKRWGIISLLKTDFFHRAIPWTRLILSYKTLKNDLNLKVSDRLSVVFIYGLLGFLLFVKSWPELIWVCAVFVVLLITINLSLYLFFYSKKGLRFTFFSILFNWFYYFYCGLAFTVGICFYLRDSWKPIDR